MGTSRKSIASVFIAVILLLSTLIPDQGFAQKKSGSIKIGTYDSRIVIFAWSRSDYFKQPMQKIKQQSDSAEKQHDTARIKELSVEAMSFQHLLHQMIFSTGSVSHFMLLIKDKLPELAKTAGVRMIVSKWDLDYSDPECEIVDLTNQVAALFQPKENIDKMAADIAAQAPVPIDEMGIETDMLDYYCKLYGKK